MNGLMTPCVNIGHVAHERHAPKRNRFRYGLFTLCLPLSALRDLRVPLLSINRAGPLAFHERDHGPRDGSALLPWVRGILQREGLDQVADGEVVLQTMPRMFGYVFNPVSFWYCHDMAGDLRVVLAEVRNTFGGSHNYLVAHEDGAVVHNDEVLNARKLLHVSPFFKVSGEYRFRFSRTTTGLAVAIDYYDAGRKMLSTSLAGRLDPLTTYSLLSAWLQCPFMTFGVVVRIHWQALRLLIKGIPFLGARLTGDRAALIPDQVAGNE